MAKVLGDDRDYKHNVSITSNGTSDSAFVELKAGDKVILKASADDVSDSTITTAAKISVNEVTITPLKLGENSVTLNAKDSVNYYSFTATEYDEYTFAWTAAENTGSAEVNYGGDLSNITLSLNQSSLLYGGWVRYISVKQTTDTAVSGTLKVTSNKTSAKVLANGVNNFALKDGENTTYKFTVPTDNVLGYKLTVTNTATAAENAPKPSVTVDGYPVSAGETRIILKENWITADEIQTVGISASGAVTGTIKVEPIEAGAFPADNNAKVTSAVPVWYQQKLTESGRYLFVSEDKDTTTEFFSVDGDGNKIPAKDAAYYKSGVVIYAKVSTSSSEEKTAVVKKPEKIVTEPLNLDTEVTVTEAKPYYEFEASEYAEYTFAGADSVRDAVPKENDNTIGSIVVLKKGQKVFITASKDAKLKVTKSANITKLEVGVESSEITLEKGQKAVFSYNIFAKGTYAFKTTSDKLSISGINSNIIIDEKSYKVKEFSRSSSGEFTVMNDTEGPVTFKASVSEIEINELTEGTAANVIKKANTQEYAFFRFKAAEDFRYVFSNTAKNTVRVAGSLDSSLWSEAQWIEKYTEKDENEVVFAVSATEDYELNVKKLQPTPVTVSENGVEVSFKAADIKWISFTAEKTGEYDFTFTSEATPSIYGYSTSMKGNGSYISSSKSYSISKGSNVYFRVNADADIKLSVKVSLTSEAAEFKATSNAFDTTEKVTKAYFTAAEAGVYTLNLALEEGSGSVLVQTELNSRSSSYLSTTSERSYALASGESIYFTLNAGMKGSITISKEASMKDITVGADMGIPAGKTWLRFAAPEDGTYQFTLSDKADSVKSYTSNDVSGRGTPYNTDIEVELSKDENRYFLIEATQPIRIQVQQVTVEWADIWDSESNENSWTLDKGDTKIIKLEYYNEYPAAYKIVTNATQNVKVSYKWTYDTSYQDLGSGMRLETPALEFYESNELCIKLTGLSNNTTVNLNPVFVASIILMGYDAEYVINGERTFQFTAPKKGRYSFNLYEYNEGIENDLLYGVLKDKDGNILDEQREQYYPADEEYGLYFSRDLERGETVRLTISSKLSYNEDERYFYLYAILNTNATLSEGNSYYGNLIGGERLTASFTPTESGTYRFSIYNYSDESSIEVYSWGQEDWDLNVSSNDNDSFDLDMESGNTQYLSLHSYDNSNYRILVQKVSDLEE